MKSEYKFESYGRLAKPLILGRIIRLIMSGWCIFALYIIYINYSGFINGPPGDAMVWVLILFSLHLLPFVINIGYGKLWRSKPQMWYIIMLYLVTLLGNNLEHTPWPSLTGYLVMILPVYIYTHLGISFFFAALLATPGCEMRALPHLWGLITKKEIKEHFCPGFLDNVDRWEQKLDKN